MIETILVGLALAVIVHLAMDVLNIGDERTRKGVVLLIFIVALVWALFGGAAPSFR